MVPCAIVIHTDGRDCAVTHSTNVVSLGGTGIEFLRVLPIGELDDTTCGDENVARADVTVHPASFMKTT